MEFSYILSSFLSLICIWTGSGLQHWLSLQITHAYGPSSHQTRLTVSPFCIKRAGKSQKNLWKGEKKGIKCISLQTAKQWSLGKGKPPSVPWPCQQHWQPQAQISPKTSCCSPGHQEFLNQSVTHPPFRIHHDQSLNSPLGIPGTHSLEGFLEKALCHHATGR